MVLLVLERKRLQAVIDVRRHDIAVCVEVRTNTEVVARCCKGSDVVTGKVDVRSVEIPDFEPVEADLEVQDDEESEDELITEGIEE